MLTAFLSQPPSTPDLKIPSVSEKATETIRKALERGDISEEIYTPKSSTWQTPQGVLILTGRGDAPIKSQSVENGTVGVFKRDSGTVGVLQCVKGNWETLYTEEEARNKFSLKAELVPCHNCGEPTFEDEDYEEGGDYYCPNCYEAYYGEDEFTCHCCGYEGPESEFSYFNGKLYCKDCHDKLQEERKASKPSKQEWVPLTPSNYKEGATVRVSPSVEYPCFGWRNVTHESRGTIKHYNSVMGEETEAEINFPYRKSSWRGKFSELEILV